MRENSPLREWVFSGKLEHMSRAGIRPEREERWQRVWEAHNIYRTPEHPKNGMYVLDMFPYPSAHGLHVGHPEGYTASDIYARYLRHRGRDVLHPMGFDSFGLPAENYAIKTGTHPAKTTADNIDNMRKQIKSLGFSYDWEREVITSDPKYYKWTQWIFVKLFEAGLAYEADAPINWCPRDLTGLANEEVVNGKCERCGTEVTKKKIKQWLVKITDEKYINRLLNDLDNLDWPENIKEMQRNWIGKSEGAECDFEVKDTKEKIRVFTTRPDTLFGATYMVLSPEHELVEKITTDEQKEKVQEYKKQASGKSDLERTELAKEKTGEFTGSYAINPVNGKDIPIWIADYVLATYGTGAIMAVPAHDERDYTFAKKFGLEIIEVVDVKNKEEGKATTGEGVAIHSGEFNGLTTKEFKEKIIQWLEKEGKGHRAVNYKMRDWLFSRQRYWGEPIPIVHCDTCKKKIEKEAHEIHFYNQQTWNKILSGKKTVETRALNPEEKERYFGDIRPGEYLKMKNMISGEIQYAEIIEAKTYKTLKSFMEDGDMFTGLSPDVAYADEKELEAAYQFTPDYVERIKKNGLVGWRIRLIQPGNVAVSENQLPLELPDVEKYEPTGTGESPLAHIDEWVNTTCPTCDGKAKRETNTMPQWAGSNWYFLRYTDPSNKKELADKKKINAWLPVEMYIGGAEHAVLHLLYARFIYKFLFDIGVIPKECGDEPFKTLKNQGLILGEDMQKMSKSRGNVVNPDDVINEYGADVMRMYEMFMGPFEDAKPWSMQGMVGVKRFLGKVESLYEDTIAEQKETTIKDSDAFRWLHKAVHKVTQDIESFKFNTAISALMEYVNYLSAAEKATRQEFIVLVILLSPFAPHLSEELWQKLHGRTEKEFSKEHSVTVQPWPTYDESKLEEDAFILVVMVNGKKRDEMKLPKEATPDYIKKAVFESDKVKKWTEGKEIKMEKYVPEKIYTIVVQ